VACYLLFSSLDIDALFIFTAAKSFDFSYWLGFGFLLALQPCANLYSGVIQALSVCDLITVTMELGLIACKIQPSGKG
jgi:hypothetical protein